MRRAREAPALRRSSDQLHGLAGSVGGTRTGLSRPVLPRSGPVAACGRSQVARDRVGHEAGHGRFGCRTMARPPYCRLRAGQGGERLTTEHTPHDHDLVLVVDFGAQYAQLIARRVREARVYSEIVPPPCRPSEMLGASRPKAVILSGGPQSVYAPGAPQVDPALFDAGVPMFGICYGFQAMALALGGDVARTGLSEFGRTAARRQRAAARCWPGCPTEHRVWMSHGDAVRAAPPGFTTLAAHRGRRGRRVRGPRPPARRGAVPPRGAAHRARPGGARALPARRRRLPADLDDGQHRRGAGRADPRPGRRQAGDLRAVRRRRLRGRGRARPARGRRPAHLRVRRPRPAARGRGRAGRARLRRRDRGRRSRSSTPPSGSWTRWPASPTRRRSARSSAASSSGSSRPAEREVVADAGAHGETVEFLVQGTLYPDVVESGGGDAARRTSRATTTSAACPTTCSSRWSSRCARCSRTRCAGSASELGLPAEIVWRQPFPGPGLGIRIIGEVDAERLDDPARGRRRSPARSSPWPASTARSGSARSCCSPTSARSACRATAAPTATRSCCARSPARTP